MYIQNICEKKVTRDFKCVVNILLFSSYISLLDTFKYNSLKLVSEKINFILSWISKMW